jgi:hypothetical protein
MISNPDPRFVSGRHLNVFPKPAVNSGCEPPTTVAAARRRPKFGDPSPPDPHVSRSIGNVFNGKQQEEYITGSSTAGTPVHGDARSTAVVELHRAIPCRQGLQY